MTRVYLDNAATTPLSSAAANAMAAYMRPGVEAPFGNANSLYSVGREAFRALEDARARTARALGARPDEIVFTSGATEADNAALIGCAIAARERRRARGNHGVCRVLTSRIEHDAVLSCDRMLAQLGFEVDRVGNDRDGRIDPEAFSAALTPDTVLASVMAANNEVGTVQPVAELARRAHAAGALFHTDAVQALGKIEADVRAWGVDAASFSAHKVGGPKGVGVLYLRAGTPFFPYAAGGGQEGGLRSGTQNVCGIVGAAAAIEAAVEGRASFRLRAGAMRDRLYAELSSVRGVVPSVAVEAGATGFLPNIVNVCVRGFESQTLILQLDARGICVSGGSACSSGSLDPSHVLTALGVERNLAQGSVRVSLGFDTSESDVDAFLRAFREVVA